tara:strand:- start:755 stop:1168 length:414 start_codon:yes stop_codon:yes gene_type:complete
MTKRDSMAERYGVPVTGFCKICGAEGYTEMHHIISQSKIKKMNRPELLTNPNNIIELCRSCHNATDSSLYRRWYMRQERKINHEDVDEDKIYASLLEKYSELGRYQCAGHTKMGGRRCRKSVAKENGYCLTHIHQRK